MSRLQNAFHTVVVANSKLGGAKTTKVQRKNICKGFIAWAFQNNHRLISIKDTTCELVAEFVKVQLAKGISVGTVHNRLASIRRAMRALGRDPDTQGITAKAVGLPSRDRAGTKEPTPDEVLARALQKALEIGEPGLAIMLELERLLGHRGQEAVMCIKDLERCAIEASELTDLKISISRGTKGGRYRDTQVIHARAHETLLLIRRALDYASTHGGFLIEGANAGLKAARLKYHRLARQVGLTGKHSPHSLRYAYAFDKILEMRDAGLNREEAMSLVAAYLGHGPSRRRYISKVYGKSVVHTVPIEKRKSRIKRAIANIDRVAAAMLPPH